MLARGGCPQTKRLSRGDAPPVSPPRAESTVLSEKVALCAVESANPTVRFLLLLLFALLGGLGFVHLMP